MKNCFMRFLFVALGLSISTLEAASINLESYASKFDSIPIAVTRFFPSTGTELMDNRPADVIAADLCYAGRFSVLSRDTLNPVELLAKNIGIAVGGDYTISGKNISLNCYIKDVATGEQLFGKRYLGDISTVRSMAHRFSNLVWETILGDKGVFESKIIYVEDNGYNKDIGVMDYDGANARRVTRDGMVNIFPAFIDSTGFLYTSFQRGKPDLYRGDLYNAKEVKAISYGRFISTSPAVSPVDNTVAFACSKNGSLDVYTANRSGDNLRQLTFGKSIDTAPCWSPNGYSIAFTSDRSGSPQIYVMDADGVNVRRLTYDGGYQDSPCWSPKGDKIAYGSLQAGKFDVWVINADGSNPVKVTALAGSNEYPTWAPDGSVLAFVNTRSGKSDIYTVKPDGSSIHRITTTGRAKMPDWSRN